jgi:hypothetical protein
MYEVTQRTCSFGFVIRKEVAADLQSLLFETLKLFELPRASARGLRLKGNGFSQIVVIFRLFGLKN